MMYASALLVDDDPISTLITRKILELQGVCNNAIAVSDPLEALSFLEKTESFFEQTPALMVVDVQMPYMNGLDFLAAIRERYREKLVGIKIIVLTSFINSADGRRAKLLQVDAYLSKPFSKEYAQKIMAA